MNIEHPESKRQQLIHVLAEEATKLVLSGEFTAEGAVNAAMKTNQGDVLDQRRALYGSTIAEVRRRVKRAKNATDTAPTPATRSTINRPVDRNIMMRDAMIAEQRRIQLAEELGIADPGDPAA